MSLTYAPNVRNGGSGRTAPGDLDEHDWHQTATADTGTSHTLPGRLYVVQCEWCSNAFAARTKVEALALFRTHEAEMLGAV